MRSVNKNIFSVNEFLSNAFAPGQELLSLLYKDSEVLMFLEAVISLSIAASGGTDDDMIQERNAQSFARGGDITSE